MSIFPPIESDQKSEWTLAIEVADQLQAAIIDCLAAHAESVERFGTDRPELLDAIPVLLREKMTRQRQKVDATLAGSDVQAHVAHWSRSPGACVSSCVGSETVNADQAHGPALAPNSQPSARAGRKRPDHSGS